MPRQVALRRISAEQKGWKWSFQSQSSAVGGIRTRTKSPLAWLAPRGTFMDLLVLGAADFWASFGAVDFFGGWFSILCSPCFFFGGSVIKWKPYRHWLDVCGRVSTATSCTCTGTSCALASRDSPYPHYSLAHLTRRSCRPTTHPGDKRCH